MQLIRGIENLHKLKLSQTVAPASVISIGNFDGVHLGHQHVIGTLLEQSKRLQLPSTVITFEPLAKEFFKIGSALRLGSLDQRAEQLFDLGVDQVLAIEFTADFSSYSPESFVEEVLVVGLGVKHLSVGDDFRFGKDRAGNFDFLVKFGQAHGFTVISHDTFMLDNERVSSGRVREAITSNDFELAEKLLGRKYSMSGTVSRGQQLGRTLDFPTANIVLDEANYAVKGVYAVRARLASSQVLEGVANVGIRPTVDGKENRLEVHLFDFEADIYGQIMQVEFCYKIRDEQKFDSIDRLKQQISLDARAAKNYFNQALSA